MYEFAVTPAVTQIRRRGLSITEVAAGSIGAELDLESGDRIMRVNGRVVRDYLDFRFQSGGETELSIDVRKRSGEDWELQIERDEGEDLGLSFEQIVPRQCANECLFCFCKGNPEDARPSLFIRDEDVRLSFLYGNYTTLTSITEDEMQRIIEQRLTPQYVSVHATDLEVRAYLLGIDKERADISVKLRRLLDAGIEFETLLRRWEKQPPRQLRKLHGSIVTGTLFAPILAREIKKLNDRFRTRLEVVAVPNEYFGGDVSVAGLLTGGDILAARGEFR